MKLSQQNVIFPLKCQSNSSVLVMIAILIFQLIMSFLHIACVLPLGLIIVAYVFIWTKTYQALRYIKLKK